MGDRFTWGFELSGGQRVANVDPWEEPPYQDAGWTPTRPTLTGNGGRGDRRSADRDYWLWPLPPAGPMKVLCQWLQQGIELTVHHIDADAFVEAARRSRPIWAVAPPDGIARRCPWP